MYSMIRELPSGKGFADIVLLPYRNVDAPAIVLELKYNKSADTAINQIKQQNYAGALSHYSGEIILVGISYDKKSKKHSCTIERFAKPPNKTSIQSNTKSNTNESESNTKGNTKSERLIELSEQQQAVLEFCSKQPHTAKEIFQHLSITKQAKHYQLYIDYLVVNGLLVDVTPNRKRDKRYLSVSTV